VVLLLRNGLWLRFKPFVIHPYGHFARVGGNLAFNMPIKSIVCYNIKY